MYVCRNITKFEFIEADASRLPFASDSFDCVVDTFGLCSVNDPAATIEELAVRTALTDSQRSHDAENSYIYASSALSPFLWFFLGCPTKLDCRGYASQVGNYYSSSTDARATPLCHGRQWQQSDADAAPCVSTVPMHGARLQGSCSAQSWTCLGPPPPPRPQRIRSLLLRPPRTHAARMAITIAMTTIAAYMPWHAHHLQVP